MIRGTVEHNMPPQARFDEALYAVSRERQFTFAFDLSAPTLFTPQGFAL